MNNKKNSFGAKLVNFFSGGGFYIALFLCVALVGVYAWALLFNGQSRLKAAIDPAEEASVPVGSFGTTYILSGDYDSAAPNNEYSPSDAPEEGQDAAQLGEEAHPASAGAEDGDAVTVSAPVETEPDYFVWPVSGEVDRSYSVEALSYDVTMSDWRTHAAVDIEALMGSKVYAVADGRVESVENDPLLGTMVTIRHSGGLTSVYANMGTEPTVKVGDTVKAGTVIGCVSDTALGEIAQTSHLHFAMERDGERVDPLAWLPEK